MREVHADVRIKLGLMPDNSILEPEDVIKLIGVLSEGAMEVEPLVVTFKDIDTGLITSERVFEGKVPHQ
jgi:hypothetical protein